LLEEVGVSTHRPFEDWILDETALNPESSRLLHQHLDDCRDCRALADGWERARLTLTRSGMATPAPGLADRWLQRQALQAGSRSKGGWVVLLVSLGAALVGAGLTAWGLVSLLGAPSEALQSLIRQLVTWSMWYRVSSDIVGAVSRTIPSGWVAGLGLALMIAWAGLIAVWLASLKRTAFQGVQS
jgi:hypothetical protein